jgi:hypothetical protein
LILEKAQMLAQQYEKAHQQGTVIKVNESFAAFTADVIAHYCYGESYGLLENPGKKNHLKEGLGGLLLLVHVFYFLPFLPKLITFIPAWASQMISPSAGALADFQEKVRKQSCEALNDSMGGKLDETSSKKNTIFDALIDPSLPPSERSLDRLTDEGVIVLGAGSETTANNLSLGLYHLAENRTICEKLREELRQVMPTPTSTATWVQLEQLPYFVSPPSVVENGGLFNEDRLP